MTISHKTLSLLLALALGCGGGGRRASSPSSPAQTAIPEPTSTTPSSGGAAPNLEPTGGTPATSPVTATETGPGGDLASGLAAIRVLGVANAGFTSVLVAVRSLEVTVDGAPVAVDPSRVAATFDLANGAQAWLAGRVAMPPAGSTVHVKLALDEAGAFAMPDAAGELRTCGPPIEFDAPAEWFALRGHAVVHLDLGRSIVGGGDVRDLVPQLQVEF